MNNLTSFTVHCGAHKSGLLEHQIRTNSRDSQEANMPKKWATFMIRRELLHVQVVQFYEKSGFNESILDAMKLTCGLCVEG